MEALVSGSLPPSERELAEQHISICEGCRLELELVRAIGSQEKAPAVGKDDWTLDRIFGSAGGQGAGAPGSAPPRQDDAGADAGFEEPPSSPSVAGFPAVFPAASSDSRSTPASSADPAAASGHAESMAGEEEGKTSDGAGSWEFEPADAKANVKPPEESLFFASEALNRRKGADKKSSNLRVILWGVGGLVGAALLGVSSWFVLHLNTPDSPDIPAGSHSKPSAGVPDEASPPPDETPKPGTVQPPADNGGAKDPDVPDNSAHRAPISREPGVTSSSAAPQPAPLPSVNPPAKPPAPAPAPKAVALAPKSSESTARGAPEVPPRPTPRPYVPPPDDGPEASDSHAPAQSTPKPQPAVDSQSDKAAKSPETAPRRSDSMWRTVTPKETAPPEPSEKTPSTGEVDTPIERLHLATVDAAERGDVVALRRLRSSWKSFMAKIIGPERARAKREYADCLWAIQNVTGRRADQKETLTAYREYLLGAPAGGADSRSVSRLRQLEDALSEHR